MTRDWNLLCSETEAGFMKLKNLLWTHWTCDVKVLLDWRALKARGSVFVVCFFWHGNIVHTCSCIRWRLCRAAHRLALLIDLPVTGKSWYSEAKPNHSSIPLIYWMRERECQRSISVQAPLSLTLDWLYRPRPPLELCYTSSPWSLNTLAQHLSTPSSE